MSVQNLARDVFNGISKIVSDFTDSSSQRAKTFKEEGNVLFKDKRYSEAIDKYTEAIKCDGTEPGFYFNRSRCYSSLGLNINAADDAKQCLTLDKNYIKGYYRLAMEQQIIGDFESALQTIQAGLAVSPDNSDLRRMAEKIRLSILSNEFKQNGDIQFSKDNYSVAIDLYTKAIDILKDEKALIRRSHAYEIIGDFLNANKDVQLVLSFGEDECGKKLYKLALELKRRIDYLQEPVHLLRKASLEEASGAVCFCMEPVLSAYDGLRLRCRCVVHEHCIISYIRSKLGDKSSICDKGVACPYGCGNYVWIDDVDALTRIHFSRPFSALTTTGISPLAEHEAAKFRLWVISASFTRDELVSCPICSTPHWVNRQDDSRDVIIVKCSNPACRRRFCSYCLVPWHTGQSCDEFQRSRQNAASTVALVEASSKHCPNCHTAVTHYHGHACHHIRGCPGCGTHFCYRCLSSEEQNERLRGERARCLCEEGRWATFCTDDNILTHLTLLPFPHDNRCGCPICPDCKRNLPCEGCNGDCVVCQGIVPPGPTYLNKNSPVAIEMYMAQFYKEEGNRLFLDKQYEAAIVKFTEAIKLMPKETIFFSNRSASYAMLYQWEAAAADAQECLQLDKQFTKGYLRLGEALRQLGKNSEALHTVELGLIIDPNCTQLQKLKILLNG